MTPLTHRLPDGAIPVLLSADSPGLLHDEASAVHSYAADHPEIGPQAIADMLFRTRPARRYRALAMVSDSDELIGALQSIIDGREHACVISTTAPATSRRLAHVFPGQGGQRPGMGQLFYQSVPAFRAEVDRCAEAFSAHFGDSPLRYLLDEHFPADDRARTVQPALFTQMAGLAASWRAFGISPDVTIGHSQGEIAAAYVSGAMTLADAVRVVGIRAHAADEVAAGDYAMAVVAADRDTCEAALARSSGWAELSVVNSPNMVGISGDRETVQAIVDGFTERGTFARVIRVGYPAHTGLMNELGDTLRTNMQRQLEHPAFLDTDTNCFGATLGGPITADLPIDQYWFWNLRNTVRFDKAIAATVSDGVDTYVELAEHPTLQLAIDENLLAVASPGMTRVVGTSLKTAVDLGAFTRNLALLAVNDLHYPWDCLGVPPDGPVPLPLLDFPNAPMNEVRLWLPCDAAPAAATSETSPAPAEEAVCDPDADQIPARLLVEEWVRVSKRSLLPPRAIGIIDHTGACTDLASSLCGAAADLGATARLIDVESHDVTRDVDTQVILLPRSSSPTGAAADVAGFFGDRKWWPGVGDGITNCWLVTTAGEAVTDDDAPPDPVHAAASAGFRSIGAEHPGVGFRHLDLPGGYTTAEAAKAVVAALHTGEEHEVALRDGVVYAKRIVEANIPVADPAAAVPEHVLITGGTGHLGLEFCDHFAKLGARRISLISRSGETAAISDRLDRIRSATKTHIQVTRCDIGDRDAVSRLVAEYQDTPSDLIIHAAVDYSDLELPDISAKEVDQALRAKVIGIEHVLAAFPRTAGCRVLLCSSTAATIGGRGQIVYAAANRMLDAMAHKLRADGLDCVSVQWGQWTVHLDLDASGQAKLAGTGVVPMNPSDALALGMSPIRGNAIVLAFDLPRARSVLGPYGYGPLLSQLTSPPVEAHARVEKTDVSRRFMKLLAEAIGVDNADTIDTGVPMVAIGLDSLQALEFRRKVQIEFNHDLQVADLLGGASIADVLAQLGPASDSVERPAVDTTASAAFDVDRMRTARADLDLFGMRAMMDTLEPALRDGASHTARDIAARLEFAPRHHWLLKRWLGVLAERGHLESDSSGYRVVRPAPVPRYPDLFTLCRDLGYPDSLAAFMQGCNDRLTELAQDRVLVQEILFADGDMMTADASYRDNVVGRYLNNAAGEFIADTVSRLAGDRSPVRILELGAGIGGTTGDVIASLSGLPVEYHFTDVSNFFLRAAQQRFAEYPQLRYGILDLNADLQRAERYDIVLAANVIHNAVHVGRTLRELYELINVGGAIAFIETCTANYQLLTSMKFLMSPNPGQPHPGADDVRAGARIFLTESEWADELSGAGFTPSSELPDPDHPLRMLDQRLFTATRER